MSQKELFLKDVVERVGEKVGEKTTTEKVEQFVKHGPLYLFFEVLTLRQELEKLKKEIKAKKQIL